MIPIHADESCTKNTIDKILQGRKDILLVTSIFYTLQGEGPYTGKPAVFVRLAGCNYGSKTKVCTMCDTSFELANAKQMTFDEILKEVDYYFDKYNPKEPLLIVTGGEPGIQHNLIEFLVKYHSSYNDQHWSQIETNGSQKEFFKKVLNNSYLRGYRENSVAYDPYCIFVCSPKASEVTRKYMPLSQECLDCCDHFKFLLSANPRSPYYTIPSSIVNKLKNKDIYVSPITVYKKQYDGEISSIWDTELVDVEKTRSNYAYAAKYVMENANVVNKLSLQTHLFTAIP